MRGEAIKGFLRALENDFNLTLAECSAIELFARDGSWQTKHVLNSVKYSEAWEIDVRYAIDLRKNLPKTELVFCDTISRLGDVNCNFDIIVADNPQGTFGWNKEYCEHFDILPNIGNLFEFNSWLIFNINRKPFNYDEMADWAKRRRKFYNKEITGVLTREFLSQFYRQYFEAMGFSVKQVKIIDRNAEYLSYCCIELTKEARHEQ